MIKVKNIINDSGRAVANQFVISEWHNGSMVKATFQSYDSIICVMDFSGDDTEIVLDQQYWDYSRTTLKYLERFLELHSKKEIEAKIKNGEYVLVDLNNED